MSSVMPFTFNAVELCVVTINEKTWERAREVCKALEYGKATHEAAPRGNAIWTLFVKENFFVRLENIL